MRIPGDNLLVYLLVEFIVLAVLMPEMYGLISNVRIS